MTPFGIAVRKMRLDRRLRLLDVARALGKSPAFLSAVETGKKPIPAGLVDDVAVVMKLSPAERDELQRAADQSKKEVKVAALGVADRELVAAFARRVGTLSPEDIETIKALIFKMPGGRLPFEQRRRRGSLVPAQSAEKIWQFAACVRAVLTPNNPSEFPIMDALEFELPRYFPDFYLAVRTSAEMDGDEGRAIPMQNMIELREDVYAAACRGEGRARFTAAHELGHFLLHRDVTLARPSDKFPIYRDSEWQADTFAGGVLLPATVAGQFSTPYEAAEACKVTYHAAEVIFANYKKRGLLK